MGVSINVGTPTNILPSTNRGILDQVVAWQLFWSWNTEVRQHRGQLHVVAVSVTWNETSKRGWLWWFTSKNLRCLKNIHCFRRKYEVSIICETCCFTIILVSHPNSIPNKFSALPDVSFLLWAKQIHNAFVWQSGDKQLSSSASSSANWRPHCSRCWGIQIGVLQSFKMP